MLLPSEVALRRVLHGDAEVGPRMRPVALTIAVAVLCIRAEVRFDRRVALARIKVAAAGNFLNAGFRRGQAGLRSYLERRVAAALPRSSRIGRIPAALGAGLRVLRIRDYKMREREQRGGSHAQRKHSLQLHFIALGDQSRDGGTLQI